MASIKADFTLADGRDIKFDLAAITVSEYRSLFEKTTLKEEEDRILAAASGITVEELMALPVLDFKRLWKAFFKAFSKPLEDDPDNPN